MEQAGEIRKNSSGEWEAPKGTGYLTASEVERLLPAMAAILNLLEALLIETRNARQATQGANGRLDEVAQELRKANARHGM